MTILIVEDDESMRRLLVDSILFRKLGEIPKLAPGEIEVEAVHINKDGEDAFTVLTADNLNDAVRLLMASPQSQTPDAVLCDGFFLLAKRGFLSGEYNKPKPHWIEVAGWANKKGIPFALLTGDPDQAALARAKGYAAFEKPGGAKDAIEHLLAQVSGVRGQVPEEPDARFDDPRFTNGRRHGCLRPEKSGAGSQESEESCPVATTEGEALADSTGEP